MLRLSVISFAVGLIAFALRVCLDALHLHLNRYETSFPPSAAFYFAGQHWLWFVIPAAMTAALILIRRVKARSA